MTRSRRSIPSLVPPGRRPIAMPTADAGSQYALTMSGTATSEGTLALSTDRRYVTLAGFNAAPGVASIANTASMTVNRVVGRIDAKLELDARISCAPG